MTPQEQKTALVQAAREQGFELVRIASPALLPVHEQTFSRWIEGGHHGEMEYLARRAVSGVTAHDLQPELQSVLVLGANYFHGLPETPAANTGRISEYARTRDYHKIIRTRLKALHQNVQELGGEARYYVDTGPVFERGFAESAGIGYVGKNTMVITQEYGSWVFLAVMLLTLELPPDKNQLKLSCGRCVRCIDACPTQAIREDMTVDARRCISYLAIEHRGPIPHELRKPMGNWVFGCDICQHVCPHNHRTQVAPEPFDAIRIPSALSLHDLLGISSDDAFLAQFAGTPIMRTKRQGLLRNACVAAGNSGDRSLLGLLEEVAVREEELVAEHARWAIEQLRAIPET